MHGYVEFIDIVLLPPGYVIPPHFLGLFHVKLSRPEETQKIGLVPSRVKLAVVQRRSYHAELIEGL
jgi:hypothetical protein